MSENAILEKEICNLCGQSVPCGCVLSTLNSVVNEVINLNFELKAQWKRTYTFHESLGKRMLELEQAYKADGEVARDIIFEGARRSEEIRRVASECETHCGAILSLENQVKNIKEKFKDIHDWEKVMSEGTSSMVVRLDKLENNMKIDTYVGADQFLNRIKTIEDFISQNYEVDMGSIRERILEVQGVCIHNNGVLCEDIYSFEKRLDKLERHFSGDYQLIASTKRPHKCPICDGKGYWSRSENNMACGGRCDTCEAKGIVWG